jgi:tripartite-type tricarboxylate transporter receptor subunit TctC
MHRRTALSLLTAGTLVHPTVAQTAWPSRPIRLLVGFPPGGGVDLLARVLAEKMQQDLGQPIVIENRPGQAAGLATEIGARAAPDGYTLTMANIGTMTVNPHLYRSYLDTTREVTPISRIVAYNVFVFIPAELPVRSLAEFVTYARARPGQLNYGSAGSGGITHIAAELLNRAAGIQVVHVPYRGSAPAMADVAGGRIQMQTDIWGVGEGMVQSGRVRAIAVSGPRRSPLAPEVPTAIEQGVPFELEGWQAMVGPAGLPRPIVDRVNAALRSALADTEVAQRIRAQGNETAPSTPEELAALIAQGRATMGEVIRAAGIEAG